MPYVESAISSMAEIPPLVASFASARGWAVSGNVLTMPGSDLALTFAASGTFYSVTPSESGQTLVVDSPRTFTGGASAPTRLHLFGNTITEPWIAGVIEYGFNSYRHFYIGRLNRYGNYQGGEVVSGNEASYSTDNIRYPLRMENQPYLFGALFETLTVTRPNSSNANERGFCRVIHQDNPATFRRFFQSSSLSMDNNISTLSVFGGHADNFIDGLVKYGQNNVAGSSLLVPVNLYVSIFGGTSNQFIPIGNVVGARLINMNAIEPNTEIEVGNEFWRCFPEYRKSTATSRSTRDSPETSYFLGVAYNTE